MSDTTPGFSSDSAAPSDIEAEVQRVNLRRKLFGDASDLARFGRYLVVDVIGAGGMATVFRGYDPDLDRSVALKVISKKLLARSGDAPARMEREARTLAKLSHPNVVTVHEVGTADGRLYLAMEFVDGRDLAGWTKAEGASAPLAETLALLLAAGRGLSAAHAAGIVHRDFKPANVLIGTDGRVRVADFGLARALEFADGPSREDSEGSTAVKDQAGLVTETGSVLGTPAYMAPEQHLGGRGDARSDQYAYCLTAWECLFGGRPSTHEPNPSTPRTRAVSKALRLGLSAAPEDRYPSMDALLEAMADDPTRRRRITAVAVGGVLLAAATALGVSAEREARCRNAAKQGEQVWSVGRRERLSAAFAGVDWALASDSWRRFEDQADAWVDDWTAASASTCRAAKLDHTIDPEAFANRSTCLRESMDSFDAVLDVLEIPDRPLAFAAPTIALTLSPAARCERPPHPAARAPVDARALARALGQIDAGRPDEAIPVLESIRDDALARGDVARSGRAHLALGWAHGDDAPETAKIAFESAFWDALAARDDDTLARSAEQLAGVLIPAGKLDDAARFVRIAETVATRMDASPSRRASIVSMQARLHHARGDRNKALDAFEQALTLAQDELGPEHPRTLGFMRNLAEQQMLVGNLAAAHELASTAYTMRRAFFGEQHPETALGLKALGKLDGYRGDHAAALDKFDRARQVFEDAYGPDSLELAMTHSATATSLSVLGRLREAEASSRSAISILERVAPATDRRVHGAKVTLARSLSPQGRCAEVIPLLQDVTQTRDVKGVQGALANVILGACLLAQRRPDEAQPLLEAARPTFEKQPDAGASVDTWLAEALLQRGDPDAAASVVQAALDRLPDSPRVGWARRDLLARSASIALAQGKHDVAVARSAQVLALLDDEGAAPSKRIAARARHAIVLLQAGRPADAAAVAEQAAGALTPQLTQETPDVIQGKLQLVLAVARHDRAAAARVLDLIPENRDPEYADLRHQALVLVRSE